MKFKAAQFREHDPYGWGIFAEWPDGEPTEFDWAEDGLGMTEVEATHVAMRANKELGDDFTMWMSNPDTLRRWAREFRASNEDLEVRIREAITTLDGLIGGDPLATDDLAGALTPVRDVLAATLQG